MLKKKVFKTLIAGIVSLSLILGQGVVFAAGLYNTSIIQRTLTSVPYHKIEKTTFYVVTDGVRVRAEPTTTSTIVGLLYFGNRDYIIADYETDDGMWVLGITSTGKAGWVSVQYLTLWPYNG